MFLEVFVWEPLEYTGALGPLRDMRNSMAEVAEKVATDFRDTPLFARQRGGGRLGRTLQALIGLTLVNPVDGPWGG